MLETVSFSDSFHAKSYPSFVSDKKSLGYLENAFKSVGWKILSGPEECGKTELLKAACHSFSIENNSADSPLIIWLDMSSAFNDEECITAISHQLSLRGSYPVEVHISLKHFLESLPKNSVIVLDHVDIIVCSEMIQILDLFADEYCLILCCRDMSTIVLSDIKEETIKEKIVLSNLESFDALSFAVQMLCTNNIDAFEAGIITAIAGLSPVSPGAISRYCRIRAEAVNPFPALPLADASRYIRENVLTAGDLALLRCLCILFKYEGKAFPRRLGWYLSRDMPVFQRSGTTSEEQPKISYAVDSSVLSRESSEPTRIWMECWDRLIRMGLLDATSSAQGVDIPFRMAPSAFISELIGSVELPDEYGLISSRWLRYFHFWADEWASSVEMGAQNDGLMCPGNDENSEITVDGTDNEPGSRGRRNGVSKKAICTPLQCANLPRSAVSKGPARTALDAFDMYRHHFEMLLGIWEDGPGAKMLEDALGNFSAGSGLVSDSESSGPQDASALAVPVRAALARRLAGRLNFFFVCRESTTRALLLAKAILDDCLESSDVCCRVQASIDLGLQYLRAERRIDAVSLFRLTITTIQSHNDSLEEAVQSALGSSNSTAVTNLWLFAVPVELYACAVTCLGLSLANSVEDKDEEEVMLVLEDALLQWRSTDGNRPELVEVLVELGNLYGTTRLFDKAEQLLLEAQEECSRLYGRVHPATGWARHQLARLKQLQGKHLEAEPLLQGALNVYVQNYGKGQMQEADILRDLGLSYMMTDKHLDAIKVLRSALEIYRDVRDDDDPTIADVMVEIGTTLEAAGSMPAALDVYGDALNMLQKRYGESDIRIARALYCFGAAKMSNKNYEEAKLMLERALAIYQSTRGEFDPLVGDVAVTLGQLFEDMEQYTEAEEMYARGLEIFREAGLARHEDVGRVLVMIGKMRFDREKYYEAEDVLEEAIIIYRRKYGDHDKKVAEAYTILGNVYFDSERPYEAQEVYERALTAYKVLHDYPKPHIEVADALCSVALAHQAQRNFDNSKEHLDSALSMMFDMYGQNHEQVARVFVNLGSMSEDAGRKEEALEYFDRAMDTLKATFGPKHVRIAALLTNIGELFEEEGSYVEARKMYNEAIEMYSELLGESHPAVQDVSDRLDGIADKEKNGCVVS